MDAQTEAIDRALQILGEHFDHVQILATVDEDGVSDFVHIGCGNWYARQGMAHQFISTDRARDIGNEVAEAVAHDDDGDEEQSV